MKIIHLLKRLPEDFIRSIYYQIVIFALNLRYDIEIKNMDSLKPYLNNEQKGVLILSNHLSFLDGILIAAPIVSKYNKKALINPCVVERFYPKDADSILKHFFDLSYGIRVPKYGKKESIRDKHLLEEMIDLIINHVDSGRNVLFFPEGGLKKQSNHIFHGVSGLHRILQKNPDIPLVFCRIEKLWGSSFSHAFTGKEPRFNKILMKGIKHTFKNFIFFNPKRKITLRFCEEPGEFPRHASRQTINKFLEQWYNSDFPDGKEPFVFVPYSRRE